MTYQLVLASSSPYRRQLLERLQLPFTTESPEIDETPGERESPAALAGRLATAKARTVAQRHPGERRLVIGSDQVAEIDGRVLGKPGDLETAVTQLTAAAGRTLTFHTGLCVHDCSIAAATTVVEPFRVRLRQLSEARIRAYLQREPAIDAAGSFYSEGLGITLFEAFEGRDPTSLIGLPLMALTDQLIEHGMDPLAAT